MSTVIHAVQRGNAERQPRWERTQRAALLDQYRVLPAEGLSQRQAAKTLHMPRTTRHAWHVWQERLEACPQGVALFESGPGLAFLHRLVMALHVVFVELGAGGLRLVCRFLELTALHRFVGASYGTQHQVHRRVEEASVADRQEASTRLARAMPAQDMTRTQDATFTGGLCLVGIEPGSHYMRLEQVAPARDHDTWQARMAPALAGLHCQGIQATSAEAPGLLAYVDHHLGVHHAPDLFPGQHALRKAVSARMAAKQRAAAKAVMQAATALHQAQEHLHTPPGEPEKCDPECPCEAAAPLAKVEQDVAAARQAHHRLARQREQVTQRIRAMGHAYHFVDLKRGVRRTGTRIAGDIQQHSDTIRTMAQQEHLSEACLDRMAKAERGVPTMQATIEFVSGDVRQQGRQLPLPLPVSYAMHAPLLPSYALERVAATQTVTAGEP